MAGLLRLLYRDSLGLIVSLPDNDPELARAAVKGGADALKVHIGLRHAASGTTFGSFQEERARIESVMAAAQGIVVGVAIGPDAHLSPSDYEDLARTGIGFLDAFAAHLPAWVESQRGLDLLLAVDNQSSPLDLRGVGRLRPNAVELAIIPEEGYGQPLTRDDILAYSSFRAALKQPIVVPTQRRIETQDLPALVNAGVNAIMIGAVVTGAAAGGIEEASRSFRTAIDEITAGCRLTAEG